MKKSFLFISFLITSLLNISFMSCTEDDEAIQDDDTPVVLSDYIIGKWKCYKTVFELEGQQYSIPIGKNGAKNGILKEAYMEITFQEDGKCTVGMWWRMDKEEDYGWIENPATYEINGNVVTLHEISADEKFTFDETTKDLYFTGISADGTEISIYLKK